MGGVTLGAGAQSGIGNAKGACTQTRRSQFRTSGWNEEFGFLAPPGALTEGPGDVTLHAGMFSVVCAQDLFYADLHSQFRSTGRNEELGL